MEKNDGTRAYYLFGLRIIGDFGATLAVPAVFAAWFGTKIDASWGTKPYALFACLALAFGLSAFVIRKKAIAYGTEYQNLVNRYDHPADRR
ncbi:MAG: hypothetical protein QY323_01095 [Patescibacteria group bacterium]|nr:MAG: hypothetical protein QY323_01095 [Patescibacteria group bacterium]